jgi:low temperature requirement protein LtrA
MAFLLAFITSVALWWIYFDRSAAFAASALASSPDPGRLARSAFYWAQVPIVAGIIAVAAGDRLLLAQPTQPAGVATASILLGGRAIFLAGHALFKLAIWHHVSRPHIAAIIPLLLLIPIAVFLPGLAVAALAIVALVLWSLLRGRRRPWPRSRQSSPWPPGISARPLLQTLASRVTRFSTSILATGSGPSRRLSPPFLPASHC